MAVLLVAGGGIYATSSALVLDSLISNNAGYSSAYGGGIFSGHPSVKIRRMSYLQ